MKKIFYLIVINLVLGACASYSVSDSSVVDYSKKNTSGVFYTLPKKEYDIVITYQELIGKPSKYAASPNFEQLVHSLAPDFSFIKDSTQYEIMKIELQSFSIPDPKRSYFVEFKGRNNPVIKKKIGFGLSLNGSLLDGSGGFTNEAPKIVSSVIETAISLVTGSPIPTEGDSGQEIGDSVSALSIYDSELQEIVSEIVEIRTLKRKMISEGEIKNDNSLQLTAMSEREKHLLSLIRGKKEQKEKKKIIHLKTLKNGSSTAFKFSHSSGFETTRDEDAYTIEILSTSPTSAHIVNVDNLESHKKKKGIHYAVPAVCWVSIKNSSGIEKLKQLEIIPQLGTVASLPNRAGLFQSTIDFKLDENTGALLEYSGFSDEIDSGAVTGLATSIGENSQWTNPYFNEERRIKEMELEIKKKELQLQLDSLNR